jgi:predicted ATP-binding protein involved in virulence
MLKKIIIEKLFDNDKFNYEIELKDRVTILTGPNGYGKTTILRMIDALAKNDKFLFFRKVFKKIIFKFSDGASFEILKEKNSSFTIKRNDLPHENLYIDLEFLAEEIRQTRKDEGKPLSPSDESFLWQSIRHPKQQGSSPNHGEINKSIINILASFPMTHLVNDQRLNISENGTSNLTIEILYKDAGIAKNIIERIEKHSEQMIEYIGQEMETYEELEQELNRSFPKRLLMASNGITEESYKEKYEKLNILQHRLVNFDLPKLIDDTPSAYNKEDAKTLFAYLEDTEKKLKSFDKLLQRLELFTTILNDRRLLFKNIHVNKEKGFSFILDNGGTLPLRDLSSGEKHEVILLFELLFKTEPGTLVLIDEPEMSLHVAWQKEFLDDITQIAELQDIQVILATHSPQIINGRWDLTVDLEEITR